MTHRVEKRWLIAAGFVIAGAALYFGFFRGRDLVVTLTQDQIQERLDAAFPITRSHLLVFSVTYSSPRVTLLEATDRIRVEADAVLNITLGV